jgi:hypothetical protein
MRDQVQRILKLACIALGALLIFQVVRVAVQNNPLAKISIPEVPTLSSDDTNAPAAAAGAHSPSAKSGTNIQAAASTNAAGTNISGASLSKVDTNAVSAVTSPSQSENESTNAVQSTNALVTAVSDPSSSGTNAPVESAMSKVETNSTAQIAVPSAGTNENAVVIPVETGTNNVALQTQTKGGTNSSASGIGTNATSVGVTNKPPGLRPAMARAGTPGAGGGKPLPELPPAIKARIDKIYESELLGQVMRPMPAALMGIAGNSAILRSSSGQTGLVKEGDSLGEMKLIRIGINRVLVEEKGEKKELMIFNGYGGESLLSKKETPDETTPK